MEDNIFYLLISSRYYLFNLGGQLEIVLAPYRAEAKAGKPLPYNTVLMDSEKDVAERVSFW